MKSFKTREIQDEGEVERATDEVVGNWEPEDLKISVFSMNLLISGMPFRGSSIS